MGTAVGFVVTWDEYAGSPREFAESHLEIFSRREQYGDKRQYDDLNELLKQEQRRGSVVEIVYVYQHSGTWFDTESFQGRVPQGHYEFDCAVAGAIYRTPEEIRREYGVRRITKRIREEVQACLKDEIRLYTAWVNGDCWQYNLVDEDGMVVDGCGGYFGADEAKEAAREALRDAQAAEEHAAA